jgi:hypothetical protein
MTITSIAFGLVSGFLGWMLTEFLAKPFRKGVDLSSDVRTKLIVFDNVQARYRETATEEQLTDLAIPEQAEKRLRDAEETFRDLGARLQAFTASEPMATTCLRVLGIDFKDAGAALIGLSNSVGVYGKQRAHFKQRLESALRFRIFSQGSQN